MRSPAVFHLPGRLRRAIACACLAFTLPALHAQALPGGGELGMTPQQLQQAVPALQRVPRPVHMAGGLTGSWRAPPVEIGGVLLAPTFFFADGELRRVEYVAAAGAEANAYESLLAWGRTAWGPELASQGSEGAYAAWTAASLDAYLQQPGAGQRGAVRLVLKLRVVKDASEL